MITIGCAGNDFFEMVNAELSSRFTGNRCVASHESGEAKPSRVVRAFA